MNAPDRRKAFLAAYRVTASITAAAKACKMQRDIHYRWLDSKPYREAFDAAKEEAAQTLEDEAVRRALEGDFEPNVYRGQFAYAKADYTKDRKTGELKLKRNAQPLGLFKKSDQLIQFLLKGMRPEKYRDSFKGEMSVAMSGEISLEAQRLKTLSDDELARLIEIAAKLAAPGPAEGGAEPPGAE